MDGVTAEKHTAMLRYRFLKKLTLVLRLLEILAVSVVLLYSSARLPSAVSVVSAFIRRLVPFVLGPRFLFLIGNAIVLTLFFRSRPNNNNNAIASVLPNQEPTNINRSSSEEDLELDQISSAFAAPVLPPADDVVFEDKSVCVDETPTRASKVCRRSRSEKIQRRARPAAAADLRRSNTDVVSMKESDDADEFRKTIEAFIERQLRFQREEEESMAIVRSDGLTCSAGITEAKRDIKRFRGKGGEFEWK